MLLKKQKSAKLTSLELVHRFFRDISSSELVILCEQGWQNEMKRNVRAMQIYLALV